jgi:hypothetical protein
MRYLRARVLESLGRAKDADPLVGDPKQVLSSYGPWWAIRGRLLRGGPDGAGADGSFWEAVAADPLSIEAACEGIGPSSAPKDPKNQPLCDAARTRAEPDIGRD